MGGRWRGSLHTVFVNSEGQIILQLERKEPVKHRNTRKRINKGL